MRNYVQGKNRISLEELNKLYSNGKIDFDTYWFRRSEITQKKNERKLERNLKLN